MVFDPAAGETAFLRGGVLGVGWGVGMGVWVIGVLLCVVMIVALLGCVVVVDVLFAC